VTAQLAPLVVGEGVEAGHPEGAHGTVVGTFRHGCYVQVHGDIYAIAGPAVAPGPIHLVLAQAPHPIPEGLAVWREGELLRSTEWKIDLSAAPNFAPSRPGPAELHAAAPALTSMLEGLPVPADLLRTWDQIRRAIGARDVEASRALLEGRGGGLTPTGDDILAGLLLVQAWGGKDPEGLVTVARSAATTNLSRTFLAWAARGQSLAPVHDLVACAAAGDAAGFDQLVATVSAIGGSSGTALLWGLGLAVTAAAAVS